MQKIFCVFFWVSAVAFTSNAQVADTAKAMHEIDSLMKGFNDQMNKMQGNNDTAHFAENEIEEVDDQPRTLNYIVEHPDNVFILCIDLKKNLIQSLPEGFENLTDLIPRFVSAQTEIFKEI